METARRVSELGRAPSAAASEEGPGAGMPDDLSERTRALVKATVPALEQHGLAITRRMYERMFQNEAIRDLFNQSHHGESGSQPTEEVRRGDDFDEAGLITVDWLRSNTPMAEADYFLCGPRAFLRYFVSGLARAGVASERIPYEFFGPADELLAA